MKYRLVSLAILLVMPLSDLFARAGRGGSYSGSSSSVSSSRSSSSYKSSSGSGTSTSASGTRPYTSGPTYRFEKDREISEAIIDIDLRADFSIHIHERITFVPKAPGYWKDPYLRGLQRTLQVPEYPGGSEVVVDSVSGFGSSGYMGIEGIEIAKSSDNPTDTVDLRYAVIPKARHLGSALNFLSLDIGKESVLKLTIRASSGWKFSAVTSAGESYLSAVDIASELPLTCSAQCTVQPITHGQKLHLIFAERASGSSVQISAEKAAIHEFSYDLNIRKNLQQDWSLAWQAMSGSAARAPAIPWRSTSYVLEAGQKSIDASPVYTAATHGDLRQRFWAGNFLSLAPRSGTQTAAGSRLGFSGGYSQIGHAVATGTDNLVFAYLARHNEAYQVGPVKLRVTLPEDCGRPEHIMFFAQQGESSSLGQYASLLPLGGIWEYDPASGNWLFPYDLDSKVNLVAAIRTPCGSGVADVLGREFFAMRALLSSIGGYYFLAWLRYFGPWLFLVAFIVIFRAVRKARHRRVLRQRQEHEREAAQITDLEAAIRKHDPDFSWINLTKMVTHIANVVQQAWSDNKIHAVRAWLSQGMVSRLHLQLQLMIEQEGQRNRTAKFRVLSLSPAGAPEFQGDYESVHIALTAEIASIEIAATMSESEVAERLSKQRPAVFSEVYSLTRKVGARTPVSGGLLHGLCPKCGKPAERLTQTNKCAHCTTLFSSAQFDWVLTEITQIEEWTNRARAARITDDPPGGLQMLEDRAAFLFWNWLAAYSLANTALLRRHCARPFYENFRKTLTEKHPVLLPVVGAVDTIQLQGSTQGLMLARVKVKYSRALERFTPATYAERVLTLGVNPGEKMAAATGFADYGCPSCGAPLPEQDSDRCNYCASELPVESADWRLFDISPPSP